jgi:ATP-dependent DNA helicase RecQ
VPPYVIFHDRTLAAIAAARPAVTDELARVKGVGPAKLAAYGEELLRLIR